MSKRYIAITYDVCKHHDLYEGMNKYMLGSSGENKEYRFKEYECDCEQ